MSDTKDIIPFSRAYSTNLEEEYICTALKSGKTSGNGPYLARAESLLNEIHKSSKVMLTTSGTHALEMCALLTEFGENDEFILPSFTFSSTANAFLLFGGKPVFVDIRKDTLCIDEQLIEETITERTKAIVAVHYAGVACEMSTINDIAKRHGLFVIEDNAHGLFASYNGQTLGTIGDLSALSFHDTKNITCGEGGALILNNETYYHRAEILREKGTNRNSFLRGEIDKYSWVDIGSSYIPSEINAAYLLAQLERRFEIQSRRHAIWSAYHVHLTDWARSNDIRLPIVPPQCDHPAHMYYMIMPSQQAREAFMAFMKERRIQTAFHYQSLASSKKGRAINPSNKQCAVSDQMSDCLVRLPLHLHVSDDDLSYIIDCILQFSTRNVCA
ncbi:MAG: dTDP-4-amino-4,6-dideoxygalactose transaminase [Candidatus Kapabacteria bacterium]|nr:dTDP-4-amino-4,6-dideoxygalactose transaminase [Candidatus Kapabacteria bacterium]